MLVIRAEIPEDQEALTRLHDAAFNNQNQESVLVKRIRESERYVPELSLVAVEDGQLVGHALFSKADVVNDVNDREVIVLAPIAVSPDRQRQGIGGRLIREGLSRCTEHGYTHVFLLGHPSYYPSFGFTPARLLGFELTQWTVRDEVFMVHVLPPAADREPLQGELMYPATFF